MKAPYPYWGGKSAVAAEVWQRLGDTANFVEPFFGSGAVLLARPDSHSWWDRTETVNDLDGLLCVGPDTRILRADLRWAKASDVKAGDSLLGFDEDNGPAREGLRAPTRYRRWQKTAVIQVNRLKKPCYRLTFDDGTSVVSSAEHLWLGGSHRTGGRGWRWVRTDRLVCNRETQRSWILKLATVVEPEGSYEAGWLAGFFDGEGNLKPTPGWQVSVCQRLGAEADLTEALLTERGFQVTRDVRRRLPTHSDVANLSITGGMRETLSFLMRIRPERLIRNLQESLPRRSIYGRDHHAVGLVSKEFIGEQEVVAITTTSHTFVAEGLASHNCNFWRSVQAEPDAVAHWADWPVNENDLHARHAWLVARKDSLQARLEGEPNYHDAKIAGWWLWGICLWIGSGWCSGDGPWHVADGELALGETDGTGSRRQLPHLGDGMGINRKLPHLGGGRGINRKLPHLGDDGMGINRQLPHLGNDGMGLCEVWSEHLRHMMRQLSDRLRRVRVCCGDWSRVCGPTPTEKLGLTGVFLDPPYASEGRDSTLYRVEMETADTVREWALAHGDNPLYRVALCGYEGEHEMPGWTQYRWKAHGGYGSQGENRGRANSARETIWFSPHCLGTLQPSLFAPP